MDDSTLRLAMERIAAADEAVRSYRSQYEPLLAEVARRQEEAVRATRFAQDAMARIEDSIRAAEAFASYVLPVPLAAAEAAYRAVAELAEMAKRADQLEERLRRDMPAVVLDLDPDEMSAAADIAELDGIPVAWVPRLEITRALVARGDGGARMSHLASTSSEVLSDCRQVCGERSGMWAPECLEAAEALEAGFPAAAQSLAANVIDTVVRAVGGHAVVIGDAGRPLDDDAPYIALGELMAIKPILRSMVSWYPRSGQPLPGHFSRHATAHAIGHPGVSSREKALVAVMLATSLARQFGPPSGAQVPPP